MISSDLAFSVSSSYVSGIFGGGFGTGNSLECATGRIADETFGYLRLFFPFHIEPADFA